MINPPPPNPGRHLQEPPYSQNLALNTRQKTISSAYNSLETNNPPHKTQNSPSRTSQACNRLAVGRRERREVTHVTA